MKTFEIKFSQISSENNHLENLSTQHWLYTLLKIM